MSRVALQTTIQLRQRLLYGQLPFTFILVLQLNGRVSKSSDPTFLFSFPPRSSWNCSQKLGNLWYDIDVCNHNKLYHSRRTLIFVWIACFPCQTLLYIQYKIMLVLSGFFSAFLFLAASILNLHSVSSSTFFIVGKDGGARLAVCRTLAWLGQGLSSLYMYICSS